MVYIGVTTIKRGGRSLFFDVARQKIVVLQLQKVDCEEIGAAWMPEAAVIGHGNVGGCGGEAALRAGSQLLAKAAILRLFSKRLPTIR